MTRKFCGECGAKLVGAPPGAPAATQSAPIPEPTPQPAASRPIPSPVSTFRDATPAAYTPKHLADKILTSKGALEGERKTVTVMFSDVSGFTAMSERLDPEDVHAIMDRAFEVILTAVHRYEGTINQFLGDGVMALFGAPIAHEDHAPRALRAALAIQAGLGPLAADIKRLHGIDFSMRMGINTGSVVVGAIGRDLRMDYTAVGDTTNVAARLLSVAKPGQIVVSQRTRSIRDRSFTFDDLGEFQVKGKSEPVRAYALRASEGGRTSLEGLHDRMLTPLVGRSRELAALEEAFQRALRGDGATALVSGDAGCGKSRLLHEFRSGLEEIRHLELETSCASYGASIPYRPILETFRRYLDLTEAASLSEITRVVCARLDELADFDEDAGPLLSHFLGVADLPGHLGQLSGAELKERTGELLCRVLLAASRITPLLVVIENVHWIDESSAEVLSRLAATLPGHRLLLVLSSRPGLPAKLELPTAAMVSVGGLGAADVAHMTQALLGAPAVSAALLEILVERGVGNPLYVEELLLQLRETGKIVVVGGEATLTSPDVIVPSTIHDIIAARVDRLSDELKLTLRGAAVVGRRFGVSLLSRVIEVPPEEVRAQLAQLHETDFVFPSAVDPELMYSFKHALTQDVLYAGLLERRRRIFHAAAGRGLEDIYGTRVEEVVELLAYHFGASSDDEKAVDYALLAAEKAQRQWANGEALGYFDRALKRLGTMPDTAENRLRRIDAVLKQAEISFALGRLRAHVDALESIRKLVEAVADPPRRAAWHLWTGVLNSLTGVHPDVPIAHCREAATVAGAAGLDELRASADCFLGQVYAYAGRHQEALEAGQRALKTFEARGDVWWTCRTLWGMSLTTIPLGEWGESLEYCRRALEYGQEVNDRRLKVVGWWRTGWTHILRGAPALGLQCCEEALALSPVPYDELMTKAVKGYGLVKVGKVEEGIGLLTHVVKWLKDARLVFTAAWYGLWLADAYLIIGEYARARADAEEVLPTVRQFGYRCFEGMAERILGTALLSVDKSAAAAHLASGRQILEEVGARNEVAKALVAEARLARAVGDSEAARVTLTRAREIFEALGTLDEPRDPPPLVAVA